MKIKWRDVHCFSFFKSCKIFSTTLRCLHLFRCKKFNLVFFSYYIFFKFINFLLCFLISFILYYIFRIVDSLPKTSTGKVQKNVLREMSKEIILWPHDAPLLNPSIWGFDKIQFFANFLHEYRVSKFKIFQIILVNTKSRLEILK